MKTIDKTKVVTDIVRFNYPNIYEPVKQEETGESRYSLSILIPKEDTKTINKINSSIFEAKTQGLKEWGDIPDNIKIPLRDGDLERPDNEAYKGHYFINTTSKFQPGIVDKKLKQITNSSEMYPGCYGKVSIRFYPFKKFDVIGIGCGLNNAQKVSDGELILTRAKAEDDFYIMDDEDILSWYYP